MKARSLLALILAAGALGGCGKSSSNAAPPPPAAIPVAGLLWGTQEVPANASASTGTALLTVSADRTSIAFTVTTNATGLTGAHLHPGAPGVNGGILFDLGTVAGGLSASMTGTLSAANFSPASGIATFDDAVTALLNGDTYINIHTGSFPGGELRGQVGAVTVQSLRLSPAQETTVLAVPSTGTGSFVLGFNDGQAAFAFVLNVTGLTSAVTAAHLHAGAEGTAGGPIFTLSGPFLGTASGVLTSADFTASAVDGINTYGDAVNAILSGLTYVNVHTVNNGSGEIRGQVGAARLNAPVLNGASEAPPNASATTGAGTVVLNGLQDAATVTLTHTGFGSAITAAHIHRTSTTAAIITLASTNFASPTTVILGPADLTPINVDLLLTGGATYINIHTATYPGGEIRGSIGP